MNFKHKQKVVCEIDGKKITDVKISIDKDGTPYICQNEKDGVTAENLLGYKYSWELNKDFTNCLVTNLKPLNKTIRDVEIGDIVVDKYNNENKRMVLDVREKIVGLSECDDFENFDCFYTFEELEKYGYKLKDEPEEEIEELTMEELCKELGREVKIKK